MITIDRINKCSKGRLIISFDNSILTLNIIVDEYCDMYNNVNRFIEGLNTPLLSQREISYVVGMWLIMKEEVIKSRRDDIIDVEFYRYNKKYTFQLE